MWEPDPQTWEGEDVIILGGGPSLRSLSIPSLADELVVGCNDAYVYGPLICDMCVFGDFKWFNKHHKALKAYADSGGIVVTNESHLISRPGDKWIMKMPRQSSGLHKDALGWNFNTGASALNLALILGASRVFLLGFDMQLDKEKRMNWHPNELDKPDASIYTRMIKSFDIVARQLPGTFPNCEVFNVTDDSKLDVFPKIGTEAFWNGRH